MIHIDAVLRTFKNDKITEIVRSLAETALVRSAVIAIDKKRDGGFTKQLFKEANTGIPLHFIELEEYGWAKALNASWRHLIERSPPGERLILALSTEVNFGGKLGLSALMAAATNDRACCGYGLFRGRDEPSYRIPRNTCALWNSDVWRIVGSFDASLDEEGGMEDFELILRAYVKHSLLPFPARYLYRVAIPNADGFPEKLKREMQAIERIRQRYDPALVANLERHISLCNSTILGEVG